VTQKLSVIYKAPPGDSKVLEIFGFTFYDGQSQDVEVDDETAERIKNNPVFRPGGKAEPDKPDKHEKHR
jgi:hypothetical protein